MTLESSSVPRFSIREANELARQHYGLDLVAKELPSYRDQNFVLADESGPCYVLKFANSDEERGALEARLAALDHLHQTLPCAFPKEAGLGTAPLIKVDAYWMRLLTWVPGVPLAENPRPSLSLLSDLGAFLGRMTRAFEGFEHPCLKRRFRWDMTQLLTLKPYLTDVEGSRKDLVERELERFEAITGPALGSLRQGPLHNDANDHNLLIDDAEGRVRLGLIDFGDLLEGPLICELAIAMTYLMMEQPAKTEIAKALLEGYHGVFPLCREEVQCLIPAIRARLCASVLISSHDGRLEPDNDYVSISREPAWRLFEFLDSPEGQALEQSLESYLD